MDGGFWLPTTRTVLYVMSRTFEESHENETSDIRNARIMGAAQWILDWAISDQTTLGSNRQNQAQRDPHTEYRSNHNYEAYLLRYVAHMDGRVSTGRRERCFST
jgi:hypothetical protein